uniref:Uncharacterized protein n=1 Tax=Strongyloides stercoralis TaxID=6248 RepID=A0A0K0E6C7_STRER
MKHLSILFLTIILFNILLTPYGKPRDKSLEKSDFEDNSIEEKEINKATTKKNKKKSKIRKNRKINPFATKRPDPLYRRIINCLSSTL